MDGDFVLKGGIFTVVNKKPGSINSIHSWSTAFMIFMNIMHEKWPFKAQEYLKYMQCIRLAASRGYNIGWIAYDEQYRLKKTRLPFSSWALIDQELWVLYVATNSVSHPTAELGITNSRSSTSYNTNFDNNLNPVQNNRPHFNNGVFNRGKILKTRSKTRFFWYEHVWTCSFGGIWQDERGGGVRTL